MSDDNQNRELTAEEVMQAYADISENQQPTGSPPSPPEPPQSLQPQSLQPNETKSPERKSTGGSIERKTERIFVMIQNKTSIILITNIVVIFLGLIAGSVFNDHYPKTIASAYNIRDFMLKVSLYSIIVRFIDVFLFPFKSYLSIALLLILIGGMLSFSLGWSFSISG